MVGERDRVIVLPSALWRALDAEADTWAAETDIAGWLKQMSTDPRTLNKLTAVVRLCFEEGFYRGCLAARNNKSLADSIEEAASTHAPTLKSREGQRSDEIAQAARSVVSAWLREDNRELTAEDALSGALDGEDIVRIVAYLLETCANGGRL